VALDIQIINASSSYVPYERPPQPMTLWSAIPRGLQTFFLAAATLDAKAINDDFLLSIRATIPPNFAYVMNEVSWTISQDRALDWEDVCLLNLQNFYRGLDLNNPVSGNWMNPTQSLDQGGVSDVRTMGNGTLNWPTSPMIGTASTTGIQINFQAINGAAAAAAAGTVDFFISFWQFDLEQIRKYPINSPQPVHAR